MKAFMASIVLVAFIGSADAQQTDRQQLRAGVWERILARLEALPERWNELPPPAVPPSGRSAEEVLDAATDGEREAAHALISRLVLARPEARAQLIAQARQERALSEVDLWIPRDLADHQGLRDIDQAGLTIEAWLELAEQLGRRDVLLRVAGAALSLARLRIHPVRLVEAARRWSMLPTDFYGTQGAADVNEAYGAILYRMGHHVEAFDAHRHARQRYDQETARLARYMGSIDYELEAVVRKAHIMVASEQETKAIGRAEDALTRLRRWRQRGVSDLDRTAMANWSAPYDFLIPRLARRRGHAVEQALALAEEAHAPVLLDLLATGSRRPEDTDDPLLREERQRLQHERATLDRKLEYTIAPGERQKLQRERAVVDSQLELNELVALGSLRSTFVSGTPIDARARRALVRDVGAILLYYVAEDRIVAFLLQPGQRAPLVRFIDLSREQLQREVQALRHHLANPRWEQHAHGRRRALFDQLVAPFATVLEGTSRLTIIPHGPLHELPFEALLVDDTTPLFTRWHVSIAPSLSALHAVRAPRAKREPAPNEIAFVGIAGGTGLKLSGPAVADVGAGFGAAVQIVSPRPGSYGAYLEHAPRAHHLLIATHGKHVAKSRSGHIELAEVEGHATRLTASEIAQHPLRAELVTLAACETARGEAMLSDERLDLTRAFLIAGADAVLATRWKVPEDEGTRHFLLDFYQALRQGGPGRTPLRKDEALTEARRRAHARGDDAQLWAAWVLIGDAR